MACRAKGPPQRLRAGRIVRWTGPSQGTVCCAQEELASPSLRLTARVPRAQGQDVRGSIGRATSDRSRIASEDSTGRVQASLLPASNRHRLGRPRSRLDAIQRGRNLPPAKWKRPASGVIRPAGFRAANGRSDPAATGREGRDKECPMNAGPERPDRSQRAQANLTVWPRCCWTSTG
jgi:hypothetical protein